MKQEEKDRNYHWEIAELKQKTNELEFEISDITDQDKQQFRKLEERAIQELAASEELEELDKANQEIMKLKEEINQKNELANT